MFEKNWKKTLLNKDSQIIDSINSLNKSALQIVLISDKSKKLIGTITDGDIRRGLIKGKKLNSSISSLINTKPIFAYSNTTKKKLFYLISKYKLQHLPILDYKKKIVGLFRNFNSEEKKIIENPFFIFAGGKGKRLMPLTKHIPKPMIKVMNKPMIEHIIQNALEEGFYNFFISVNFKKNLIKKYFGDGSKWNIKIRYIEEKKPLGTAGSLAYLNYKKNNPIIVCNGDIYTELSFNELLKFHHKKKCQVTIATKPYQIKSPYGQIDFDKNRVLRVNEKPIVETFVNMGVYVFNSKIIKNLKKKHLDMNDLLKKIIKDNIIVKNYPVLDKWTDLGSHENLKKINKKK